MTVTQVMTVRRFISLLFAIVLSTGFAFSEDFFNFYIHRINTDKYPTIKITGLVEMEEFFEINYSLDILDNSLDINENEEEVEDIYFDYLQMHGRYVIFEISYTTRLPKKSDRNLIISSYCNYREYKFNDAGELAVPEQTYLHPPLGFIQNASVMVDAYLNNTPQTLFVSGNDSVELKENPSDESKTLAYAPSGSKISVSYKTYGKNYCSDNFLQSSVMGRWREVISDSITAYVPDNYLSIIPPNKDHKPIALFLTEYFGKPEFLGMDERNDSVVLFNHNIVYNTTGEKKDFGYIYFHGINRQEVLLIAKELFYNKNCHGLETREENLDEYYVFRNTCFGGDDFMVQNSRVYVDDGWSYWPGMEYSISWEWNMQSLKTKQKMGKAPLYYPSIKTSEFADIKNDLSTELSNEELKNLFSEKNFHPLKNTGSSAYISGRVCFGNLCIFVLDAGSKEKPNKWLTLIHSDYDNFIEIVDAIPCENDTISHISIPSCCQLFLHYKNDEKETFERIYFLNNYGFEKGYDSEEPSEYEKANDLINFFGM